MSLLLYLATAAALVATARPLRRISLAAAATLVLLPFVDGGVALVRGSVRAPIDLPWGTSPFAAVARESGIGPQSPNAMWDVASQTMPWWHAVRDAYAAGEWPLWNPHAAAGEPLAGSGQAAPYHPFTLLSLLLPAPHAFGFLAAVRLFAAALAMFLLARELALGEPVALLAAAGWAFAGYVHAFLLWPIGSVAAAFPLVLLGARRAARAPDARSAALLAAGFTLTILAGHPESAAYALAGAAIWFAAELVAQRARGEGSTGRALAAGTLATVAALALTAFFWLPFWEVVRGSAQHARRAAVAPPDLSAAGSEAGRHGAELMSPGLGGSLARLAPHLVPFAAGLPIHGVPEPRWRYAETAGSSYPGSLLLGAAAFGLVAGRRRWRLPLAAAVAAGLALAVRLPPAVALVRRVPLFDVAFTRDAQLWSSLALVLAAAFGVERALAGGARRLARAELATAILLGAFVALRWPAILASGLPPGTALARTAVLVAAPVAAALVLVALGRSAGSARGAAIAALLLAVLLAERRLETVQLAHRYDARFYFPPVAPLDRLPRTGDGAAGRLVGADRDLLPPNFAAVYGFEDLRTYSPLTLPRLRELAELWRRPGERPFETVDLRAPILAALDVRWALAAGCPPPPPGWRREACANGVALFVRERPTRRAWVPERVRPGGSKSERLGALAARADPASLAWIEAGARSPARESANGGCAIEAIGLGLRPRWRTRCEAPAWIVVSTAAWPGWRARTLSSSPPRELPTAIADHALVAFEAPAGASEIELVYRPPGFAAGLGISGIAALLATALGGRARLRLSRRPASPASS